MRTKYCFRKKVLLSFLNLRNIYFYSFDGNTVKKILSAPRVLTIRIGMKRALPDGADRHLPLATSPFLFAVST